MILGLELQTCKWWPAASWRPGVAQGGSYVPLGGDNGLSTPKLPYLPPKSNLRPICFKYIIQILFLSP